MSEKWQINLIGELDKGATREQINKNISELEGQLKKITISVDSSQLSEIQKKLNNLKLSINNITISDSAINNMILQINSALSKVTVQIPNISVKPTASTSDLQQTGKQLGTDLGKSINQSLKDELDNVKKNISDTLKEIQGNKIKFSEVAKIFNLNSKAGVTKEERNEIKALVDDYNKLSIAISKAKTIAEENSIWDKQVDALNTLGNKLSEIAKMNNAIGTDPTGFADYFKGKKIFIDDKSESLLNTGKNVRQLNDEFRKLGVTFTTVAEKGTKLDSIWGELSAFTHDTSILNASSFGDQIALVVEKLRASKEMMYGSLVKSPNEATDYVLSNSNRFEELYKRLAQLKEEQIRLETEIANASNTSASQVVENEQKKQEAYEKTAQKQSSSAPKVVTPITSDKSIIKSGLGVYKFDNVKEAQNYFKELLKDEKAVITTTEQFGSLNGLTSFTVNIKRATGEVESLRYGVEKITNDKGATIGKYYDYRGATTGDSGALKQIRAVENAFVNFTQKIGQFRSTNNEILSGLSAPLTDFENKLAGLKNGTYSIDEVSNAFKTLQTEASKITANFDKQLSPIDKAVSQIAKGEEVIKGLRAENKGLANSSKEVSDELNRCTTLLKNLKKIESQEGRSVNWSSTYRQYADAIDNIKAKLSSLKKEQSNSATTQIFKTQDLKDNNIAYMSKVYNTIEKQMGRINSMARAKGWTIVDISGVEKADGLISSLTLKIRDADGALKSLNMQRAQLQGNGKAQAGLIQTGDIKVLETATQAQEKLAQQIEKTNAKLAEQASKLINFGNGKSSIQTLTTGFSKLGMSATEVQSKVSGVATEYAQLESLISSGASNSAIAEQFNKFNISLKQTQNDLKQTRSEYSLLATTQQRLAFANQLEAWNQKNTKATKQVREENERYIQTLKDLDQQVTKSQLGQMKTALQQNENAMRSLNKLGASLKNQWNQAVSSFTMWISASSGVMKVISETRQAITTIKAMDTILTEISKTSDMTDQQLKKLGLSSYEAASKYGRTATDYLTGVQEMSRSGFYGEQGQSMAELSLLAQSAGDLTADLSNSYILATNAAFKYKGNAEKINEVLDGQNEITNRNSVSLQDMATAMTKAGTVASSYGVSIEDLSAMIGTVESVTKLAGEDVGTGIKSILINLQNVSSSKITKTLDQANASMTEMVNGTEKLRDPISILRDLAKTFNTLDESDPLRAQILTSVGGKYQADCCLYV